MATEKLKIYKTQL